MSLSLADFFILASVMQGCFIGLAILLAPFLRSATNKYLAGFVLLMSGMTLLGWQDWHLFWPDYLWSLMWEFLIPVFIFQYYLRVLDHPYLRAKWLPWLYGPFAFFLVIDLLIDGDFSFDIYNLPFPASNPYYMFYDALLDSMALWWNIFLVTWAFILARNDRTAPVEKRQWLVRLSIAIIGVLIVWFLSDYAQYRTNVQHPLSAIWIALSLLFWYTAYAGVYQLRITDERAEIGALLARRTRPPVPATVIITPATGKAYAGNLRRLMEEEQLYRNPELGRQLLAERLGISEGYVSQVVRESVGEGLIEYVNSHRISAAQRMLIDPDFTPYSLEAIGREAGFKSRSTFYDTFKKATGYTPGAYRKRQKPS